MVSELAARDHFSNLSIACGSTFDISAVQTENGNEFESCDVMRSLTGPWAQGDRALGTIAHGAFGRDQQCTLRGSGLDDGITPFVQGDQLGEKLRAKPVGITGHGVDGDMQCCHVKAQSGPEIALTWVGDGANRGLPRCALPRRLRKRKGHYAPGRPRRRDAGMRRGRSPG